MATVDDGAAAITVNYDYTHKIHFATFESEKPLEWFLF